MALNILTNGNYGLQSDQITYIHLSAFTAGGAMVALPAGDVDTVTTTGPFAASLVVSIDVMPAGSSDAGAPAVKLTPVVLQSDAGNGGGNIRLNISDSGGLAQIATKDFDIVVDVLAASVGLDTTNTAVEITAHAGSCWSVTVWTQQKTDTLYELHDLGFEPAEIAARMGLKQASVSNKLRYERLFRGAARPMGAISAEPVSIDTIELMLNEGLGPSEIARRLGITKGQVSGKINRAGLCKPKTVETTTMERLQELHTMMDGVLAGG